MMNKYLVILFVMTTSLSAFSNGNELKKFETDYCTLFFEGTIRKPNAWKECCYNHDLRYWFGGTKKDQHKSDLLLKECVRKNAGSFWANLMYVAVRTGHYSPIKNKYQWGWGWNVKRDFSDLSSSEKTYVRQEFEKLPLSTEFIEEFFQNYGL